MVVIWVLGAAVAGASLRSGRAEVDWISATSTYEPGKVVQTAVRLVIDAGWHSYWENPGEAGMQTSVKWELPAGWVADDLEYPLPQRFESAGVVGFGYTGTVMFPVKLTAPVGFRGMAQLKVKVSWLTCDDDTCVPGNAGLVLTLEEGAPVLTPAAPLIDQALLTVPRMRSAWEVLEVLEDKGFLSLKVPVGRAPQPDLAACEIFPATVGVIDARHGIRFSRSGDAWLARVPKGEYAPAPVRELRLVAVPKNGPPGVLYWKIR
jgi:thiol:disulfide interchange protein DsbD